MSKPRHRMLTVLTVGIAVLLAGGLLFLLHRTYSSGKPEPHTTVVTPLANPLRASDDAICQANAARFYGFYTNDNGATFCHKLKDFISTLQAVVKSDDRRALAHLIQYPLVTEVSVNDETQFLQHYDVLITPWLKEQIYHATIANVPIINYQGVMIENGFWLRYVENYDSPSSSSFVITSIAVLK